MSTCYNKSNLKVKESSEQFWIEMSISNGVERKYLYKKVTTFQLLLKSRVETHVPIPKIKYVMGVSKLQVSKNDDEEHCFLK